MLFGITQGLDPDAGALGNLIQDNGSVLRLPNGTGAVCFVLIHLIGLHNLREFL